MSLTSKPAAEVAAERKAALEQHAQILAALAEFGLSTSDPVASIAGLVRERDEAIASIEGARTGEHVPHGGNSADPLPPDEDTRRESWESFRAAGMLWMANRILHVFGWAIVVEIDDATDRILGAHPRRATWRGFCPEAEERGFISVSRFMRAAGATLADEAES